MANTVTKQTLNDGPRNYVVQLYLASDGVAGDLTDESIVDVSALVPVPTDVKLVKIEGNVSGFTATLKWDATADVPFHHIPDGEQFCFDYRDVGGLINNAGAGVTGDVLLDTTGFDTAGDNGSITFWFVKRGVDTIPTP